jgi:hypothetical protein
MADQPTPQQQIQAQIEREVRHLIGDLHIQVVTLNTILAMSQTPQPPQPEKKPEPIQTPQPPVPHPAPNVPVPETEPPLDRPDRRAANGGRHPREVAS